MTLYFIGGILIVIGVLIFIRSFSVFGRDRSIGRDIASVYTEGIYKWSRNPQNVGFFLILFGTAFLNQSLVSFILALFFIFLIQIYILYMEEDYLERLHKKDYINYKRNSSRYFGYHYISKNEEKDD